METLDTSVKIKFLIEMALQGEISWLALDSLINRLNPTLEKSRRIISILLRAFENHQMICTKKTLNDGNDFSEDITEINEDQYLAKNIQRSNSKDEIEIIDEKQIPEETLNIESDELACVDEDDFTDDKYDAEFSKAVSEEVEEFDENDVSKSIQLVEAFKGQLYTFVGDDSEENSQVLDHDKESDKKNTQTS